MYFVALAMTALAQNGNVAPQMVNGVEPRVIFQDGRVVGRGIEVNETVTGKQHFFSHVEAVKGGITEIDSWSDADGHPITAKYTEKSPYSWNVTTVKIDAGHVIMTRKSSDGGERTESATLPDQGISLLAQFDPLKIYGGSPASTVLKVSIIDPVQMAITPGDLAQKSMDSASDQQRLYDLKTSQSFFEITISSDGRFLMEKNSTGEVSKPAPWDQYYLNMAQEAGIPVNPYIVNQVLQNSPNVPQGAIRRKG